MLGRVYRLTALLVVLGVLLAGVSFALTTTEGVSGGSLSLSSPNVFAAIQGTKSKLRFDRSKYAPTGDYFNVTVTDPDQNLDPKTAETLSVEVVSVYPKTATGDQETILLTETGPDTGVFTSSFVPIIQGQAKENDGNLQVNPGDIIAALYQDPDNPQTANTPDEVLNNFDMSMDVALISGGKPKGTFKVQIDPNLLPQSMTSTPGSSQNEPPRPLAVVVNPKKVPVFYGEDQLLYRYADNQELGSFLQERGGTLVETFSIVQKDQSGTQKYDYALVRIDPSQGSLSDFAYVAELFGASGTYIFSSEKAAKLLGIVLEEQLAGRFVMHNPVLWALGEPRTVEGDLDGDGAGGDNGFAESWFSDFDVNLGQAITFLDLIDRNWERSVDVAFVDGGFASPADYGTSATHPDFGVDFASIPQGDCTRSDCSGSAGGRFPVGGFCAGGDGPLCAWHGTVVFSVAGAVANNGVGAIGVAGHARNPTTGEDGTSGIIDPMFYKIGLPFMTNLARGINKATDDNATIINVSSGFACEPLLDIDICKAETRFAIIVACEVASWLIPAPLSSLLSQVACDALVLFFELTGVADEDLLRAAVTRALANPGRVIVASGPENVAIPVIGTVGPFDAIDDEFYPCAYDGVLCVGAINTSKEPSSINPIGSGIDIWAPHGFTTMPVPGSSALTYFEGTSAAAPFITGVVSMMKAADATLTRDRIVEILQETSVPLADAPSGSCVTRTGGSCVGFVNVLAAVRAAANLPSVVCTGWEELALASGNNDTRTSAVDLGTLSLPSTPGSFVRVRVTQDGSIHALNGGTPRSTNVDEDWFKFQVSGSGWVEVRLTVPFATDALTASLSFDTTTVPLVPISEPGLRGWSTVIRVTPSVDYFISITALDPGGLNDACYNGSTLTVTVIHTPDADVTEERGGEYPLPSWEHVDFAECPPELRRLFGTGDCGTVFENGSDARVRRAVERWYISLSNLSLSRVNDIDFFRIPPLPDPANPADGGHDDIRPSRPPFRGPDPEPLLECGTTQREELGLSGTSNTIDVSMGGALIIEVQPLYRGLGSRTTISPSDERLYVYRDVNGDGRPERDESVVRREGNLRLIIDCPRSRYNILNELIFSFGERDTPRGPFDMGYYRVVVEYRIDIERNVPDWVGSPGAGRPPRVPCPSPSPLPGMPDPFALPTDFPFCPRGLPSQAIEIGLTHPLDPSNPRCMADGPGCSEAFLVDWAGGDFDVSFRAPVEMKFRLYDEDRTLIASGTPALPRSAWPSGGAGTAEIQQKDAVEQKLSISQLDAGRYVLVVEGQSQKTYTYTMTFDPLITIGNLYLPVVVR